MACLGTGHYEWCASWFVLLYKRGRDVHKISPELFTIRWHLLILLEFSIQTYSTTACQCHCSVSGNNQRIALLSDNSPQFISWVLGNYGSIIGNYVCSKNPSESAMWLRTTAYELAFDKFNILQSLGTQWICLYPRYWYGAKRVEATEK